MPSMDSMLSWQSLLENQLPRFTQQLQRNSSPLLQPRYSPLLSTQPLRAQSTPPPRAPSTPLQLKSSHTNPFTHPPATTLLQLQSWPPHNHIDWFNSRQWLTITRPSYRTLLCCPLLIIRLFIRTNLTTTLRPSSPTALWHITLRLLPSFTIKRKAFFSSTPAQASSSSVKLGALPIIIFTFLTHLSRINCDLVSR